MSENSPACPACGATMQSREYFRDELFRHYVCWPCWEMYRADKFVREVRKEERQGATA